MRDIKYYTINFITLYRLLSAPLLLALVLCHKTQIFSWLLPISFFTDAVDGYLARKYKLTSVAGARLDSIADDLTVAVAITAMVLLKPAFLHRQLLLVIILLVLFAFQTIAAIVRYGKMSSFHTYGAKAAAILQGGFFIMLFLLPAPVDWLFYFAMTVTALELVEETVIVFLLPEWKTDVKGLYWIMRSGG